MARPRTQREELVEAVAAAGVSDFRVLTALREVPRSVFVPPEQAERAFLDEPLPIPRNQVTTQPSLAAKMIEALGLSGDENVLEVGTGYGFQTALLARLARFVWSIERWGDLAEAARANLDRHGTTNAEVVVGDGTDGLERHAPFDAIVVSAAFHLIPPPLAEQLASGGRLVQPVGPGGQDEVVLFAREGNGLIRRSWVTGAHFVRLYGRHAFEWEGADGDD